jgi:hypothetical protein
MNDQDLAVAGLDSDIIQGLAMNDQDLTVAGFDSDITQGLAMNDQDLTMAGFDSDIIQGLAMNDQDLTVAGYPPTENMFDLAYSAISDALSYDYSAYENSYSPANVGLGSGCMPADSAGNVLEAEDETVTPFFSGFCESSYTRRVPPSPISGPVDILCRKWFMYTSPEMWDGFRLVEEIAALVQAKIPQKQRAAAGKKASKAPATKRNGRNPQVLKELLPNMVPNFTPNSQIIEYGSANFDHSLAQVYIDADGCMHHLPHMNSRGMTREIITKGGGETPEIIEVSGGRFTCSLCPKTYSDRGGLRRHFVKHRTGGVYCPYTANCPSLKRVFSRWDHFRGHIKTHHEDIDLENATMFEIYSKYLHRGEQPMESKLRRTIRQPRGKANKSTGAPKSPAIPIQVTPEFLFGLDDPGSQPTGNKRKFEAFEIASPLDIIPNHHLKMQRTDNF